MTLNGVMAVTLRYFTEFGKPALQKTICGGIYLSLLHFIERVQFRHKESSRSLSHLLMSFLLSTVTHMLQFLQQMFNLFALLWDCPLQPVTPLTNGAIDETLPQFAPLSDDCLLQLVDCRESSMSVSYTHLTLPTIYSV